MEELSQEITSLIESLSHSDKKIKRRASDALISVAPKVPALAQRLEQILATTPMESRWPIAYVLGHITLPSALCLEVLKQTLDSKDPDIRWAILLLLVRLAKNDKAMVRVLLELLKAGTATQRRMAVYCLRDLNLNDPVSLQALSESLRDPDPLVRVATVTSLKNRTEINEDQLDCLLQLFSDDPDSRVKYAVAFALVELASPSDKIFTALLDASQSGDPRLKKAATAALDLLKKKAHPSTAK